MQVKFNTNEARKKDRNTLSEIKASRELQVEIQHRLRWLNKPNIKHGKILEKSTNTITVEIFMPEMPLVQRPIVDHNNRWMQPWK